MILLKIVSKSLSIAIAPVVFVINAIDYYVEKHDRIDKFDDNEYSNNDC